MDMTTGEILAAIAALNREGFIVLSREAALAMLARTQVTGQDAAFKLADELGYLDKLSAQQMLDLVRRSAEPIIHRPRMRKPRMPRLSS
jgi:hypothetical protein